MYKRHNEYILSCINVLENIITNLLCWETLFILKNNYITAEIIDKLYPVYNFKASI